MDEKQVVVAQPQSNIHTAGNQRVSSRDENGVENSGWQTTHNAESVEESADLNVLGRGLTSLEKLSKLEVEQRLDILEVCLGWARNNRYCIYNEEEEQIFYIYEASVCLMRQVTGAMRGLVLKMTDEHQQDVVFLQRPGACSSRCCWFCCNLQKMDIVLPTGTVLASMHEVWSCCIPYYQIVDKDGQLLWSVRGSVCHCRCCCDISFEFITPEGDVSATVTRSWQGCKELIGAANSFSIQFSDGLTVGQKLMILSGTFLADLNYFEKQNKCW